MTDTPPDHGTERSLDSADALEAHSYQLWVRGGLWVGTLGYGLVTVTRFLQWTAGGEQIPITELPVTILLAVTLLLFDRLRIGTTVALALFAIWLEVHISLVLTGAVVGYVGLPVLPVIVMGYGLFLGRRAAVAMGIFTAVSAPLAAWSAVPLGIMPEHPPGGLDPTAIVILGATCIAVGTIVDQGVKAFGAAVRKANDNEHRFSDLFEGAPDGMILTDGRGVILSLNRSARELFATDTTLLKGTTWYEVMGLAPETTAAAIERISQGAPEPQPISLVRSDGFPLEAEITSERIVRDAEERLLVVVRDVSARQAAQERALQLGQIIEDARAEIFLVGSDPFEFLMVSRGARTNLGYSAGELLYLPVESVMPGLTEELAGRLLAGDEDSAEPLRTLTGVHRRNDGTAYPTESHIHTGTLGGRPVLTVFSIDISDRVAAEAEQENLLNQLQHAQKMDAVGALAGGVAHDFNNLLTIIGGCAEILHDELEPEQRDLVQEIQSAHEKGATLTRKLLAFARKEVVQPTVLDVAEAVRETLPLIDTLVGEQIRVESRVEECGSIMADAGQLEQILLNLAANARDAMPGGGTVRVVAQSDYDEPGFVRISFSDEGGGIDAATLPRVFDPFFTTKPRGKGTGLGLSTVHGIVSQNGGSVSIDTEPGKGTTIEIHWPLSEAEEVEDRVDPTIQASDTLSAARILVVEDNDGARKIVERYLERAGFLVVTAHDGPTALDILKRDGDSIDLALTDVIMPGMSGLEFAETLAPRFPDLPVLFMSGYMEDLFDNVENVDPATQILLKPFSGPELIERVRTALDNAARRSALPT